MVTLYDFEPSAACYRVRLLLAILGLPHDIVPVDVEPGREHLSAWFRAISPAGELPALRDGEMLLVGADAILVHLATHRDPTGLWLGDLGRTVWLARAASLSASSGRARTIIATGEGDDVLALQRAAHRDLREIERHLWFGEREGRDWLLDGAAPTIADLSVFAEVILCEEAGVSRQDYAAIRRWTDRVRRIRGFVVMSGVFPAGPAR